MVKLLVPILHGSRLIPAGAVTALPDGQEERLIAAGNAEKVNPSAVKEMSAEEYDALVKKVEAMKLDLPDDLTDRQLKDIVEKAEKDLADKAAAETPAEEIASGADTVGLNLGRSGVQAK